MQAWMGENKISIQSLSQKTFWKVATWKTNKEMQ